MFNYSQITKDSLKTDVGATIKIIQNLVLEIKQSEDIDLDSLISEIWNEYKSRSNA